MSAIHCNDLVHRDLKPENVLLVESGTASSLSRADTAPDSPPVKVTDFGLAHWLSPSNGTPHSIAGTPPYMAPEQIRGNGATYQTDVWALGVILYECVANRRPFDAGPDRSPLHDQIQSETPISLRRSHRVPRDFEAIVATCLEKNPPLRYANAGALADDLDRFIRGEPIVGSQASSLERFVRWAWRWRGYALGVTAAALAIVGVAVVGLWRKAESARGQAVAAEERSRQDQQAAEFERDRAIILTNEVERQRDVLDRISYGRTAKLAFGLSRERPDEVAGLLDASPAHLRGWEWDWLATRPWKRPDGGGMTFRGHSSNIEPFQSDVYTLAFNHDGTQLVTASEDGTARIWDVEMGRELHALWGHGRWVTSAAFSPDGALVVTTSGDHTARIWDAATGRRLRTLKGHEWSVKQGPHSLQVAPRNGQVRPLGSGPRSLEVPAFPEGVNFAAFSRDGSRVVTAGGDGTARIWEISSGRELMILRDHASWLGAAQFSPDGRKLVTLDASAARIWDSDSGRLLLTLSEHEHTAHHASFSPDGTKLVTTSGYVAHIWDVVTGKAIQTLRGHSWWVHSAHFNRSQTRIVTGANDGTVRVWDVKSGAELLTLPGGRSAMFSPDGERIATCRPDGTVCVYNRRAKQISRFPREQAPPPQPRSR